MRREGSYLFVVTALVLGLGLGLLISLVISPVEYQNVSPVLLKQEDKDIYRAMIALSYNARGDMGRARARLGLLEEADPRSALAAQAQQSIAQGKPAEEARSLALLAAALGQKPGSQTVVLPTEPMLTVPPSTPIIDLTPTLDIPITRPTNVIEAPTPEASSIPGDPFVLKDRKGICDIEFMETLQVYVIDKAGKSVPGAEVIVTWADGEDHFFTGLSPAIDPGYADFKMEVDQLYNVRLGNGGQTVTKVVTPNCRTDPGMDYKGGVKLIFGAP
jgi:hypothetical protein